MSNLFRIFWIEIWILFCQTYLDFFGLRYYPLFTPLTVWELNTPFTHPNLAIMSWWQPQSLIWGLICNHPLVMLTNLTTKRIKTYSNHLKSEKTFAKAINNVCDITFSHLPQAVIKDDTVAIRYFKPCRHNFHARIFWSTLNK